MNLGDAPATAEPPIIVTVHGQQIAIPAAVLRNLVAAHDSDKCHAHGEGVRCCFDLLEP
jgi:hypothetical protein